MKKYLSILLSIFVLLGTLFSFSASAVTYPDVSFKAETVNSTTTFTGETDQSTWKDKVEVSENVYKFNVKAYKNDDVPTAELPIKLKADTKYEVSFEYSTNGDVAYMREVSLYSGNDGILYDGETDMKVQDNFANNVNLLDTTNTSHTHNGTLSMHGKEFKTATFAFTTTSTNVPNDDCYLHFGATYGVYSKQLRVKNIIVKEIGSKNLFSGAVDESTWSTKVGDSDKVSINGEYYCLESLNNAASSFELPYNLKADHTYNISFDWKTDNTDVRVKGVYFYSGNAGMLYDGTTDMSGITVPNNANLLYNTNPTGNDNVAYCLSGSGSKSFTIKTNKTNVPNENCYLHIGAFGGIYTSKMYIKNIKIYDITDGYVVDFNGTDITNKKSSWGNVIFAQKTDEDGNCYLNINSSQQANNKLGFMTNYEVKPGANYKVEVEYTQNGPGLAYFYLCAEKTLNIDSTNRIDNKDLAVGAIPNLNEQNPAPISGTLTFYVDGSDNKVTDSGNYFMFISKLYSAGDCDLDINKITVTKFDFDNGDLDHDLTVGAGDITLITKNILGIETQTKGSMDFNEDGKVDVLDFIFLKKLAVKA